MLQQQYLQLFSIDVILHHFIAKSEGWSVIAQLYFNHPQTALFRESSNILHSCGGIAYQETVNMPNDLKAQIPLMRSQFQATEQLMKQFGVRVHHPSIKAVVQKAQVAMKKSEEKHRQNIRVKKSKIKKSPPPNDPDPDDEEDKKEKLTHENHPHDDTKNEFSKNKNRLEHNFRNEEGHFNKDTPQVRQRILDLVKNFLKRIDYDIHGNMWYDDIQPDGSQLWGEVRVCDGSGIIQNCGLNKVPRQVNPGHGLNNFKPKK